MTVCSNGYPSEYIFGDITMSTSVLGDKFASKSGTTRDRKKVGNKKKRKKKRSVRTSRVRVFDFFPSDSKFKMPYIS